MATTPAQVERPDVTRAIRRVLIIDGVCFVAAMAANFLTRNMVWVYVILGIGMAAFFAIIVPVLMKNPGVSGQQSEQPPIVQDPHGRP